MAQLTVRQLKRILDKVLPEKGFNSMWMEECFRGADAYENMEKTHPDMIDFFCLDNCNTYLYVVEDIKRLPFSLTKFVDKESKTSYLFMDTQQNFAFVDNGDTWEDYTHDVYYDDDIYVVKCPECNKTSFVNVYGSYMCRHCGDQDGDHNVDGDVLDLFEDVFEQGEALLNENKILSPKQKYDNYINSEDWRRTRTKALEKHGQKCKICGSIHNLDVHHLNYDNLGDEKKNNYNDLCVLCRSCHSKLHDFIDKNENMLINLRNSLKEVKEKYRLSYLQEIEDVFYENIKNCFEETDKKHATIILYLQSLWGQKKLDTNFISYVSVQKVYCRLKNEGKIE